MSWLGLALGRSSCGARPWAAQSLEVWFLLLIAVLRGPKVGITVGAIYGLSTT